MKTQIRLIAIIVLVVVGVIGGLYLGNKFQLFSLPFDFGRKELTIAKTANVVSEIKKIGEFTSACYYEEMAIKDERVDTEKILGIERQTKSEIVMIGKGRVRAGFNLANIRENDIQVHGDTLDIVLPHAEMFDIILNPSDFVVEYETGVWNNENTKQAKSDARDKLVKNAIANGIMQKAETAGLERLKHLFVSFGFSQVNLSIVQ